MARTSRFLTAIVAAVALATGMAPAVIAPDAQAVGGAAQDATAPQTACDEAQAAEGMVPIRSIDLPVGGQSWFDTRPTYGYEAAEIPPVDRVGYCLELSADSDQQWVWTSHQATGGASDVQLPTLSDEVNRREVYDLTVRSNVVGVAPVDHGTGWLEMWPSSYVAGASRAIPGTYDGNVFSGDALADADDSPAGGAYGSFQLHDLSAEPATTVLAVNSWATARPAIDVGIGPSSTLHPDWTFAANAAQWDTRRLTFYGRPATVLLDEAPSPWQLVPRDGQDASHVTVPFSGRVTAAGTAVILRTTTPEGTTERALDVVDGSFREEVQVPVALADTDFEVIEERDGVRRVIRTIPGVVGGDVYVVHGQSNATARRWGSTAHAAEHHFVRTFGSGTDVPGVSVSDRAWVTGRADTAIRLGSIGQWATQFGARLAEETGVPVAVMNVGHGGFPVSFFARNDADPRDPTTNYGRMLRRLEDAGLAEHVSGVFWVQGENDANDAATHVAGVTELFADLRSDLAAPSGADPELFEVQIRRSPCTDTRATELRDAQRRLARDADATLMTLNGLGAVLGCHFDFEGGYRVFGDWAYETVRSVVGGEPADGIRVPDVSSVSLLGPTTLRVELRHGDRLTIPAEAGTGFAFADGAASVTSVRQAGNALILRTDARVSRGAILEYVGFGADGPWIRNEIGMGLVTFREEVRGPAPDVVQPGGF